jgi:hypothetical protein
VIEDAVQYWALASVTLPLRASYQSEEVLTSQVVSAPQQELCSTELISLAHDIYTVDVNMAEDAVLQRKTEATDI